MKKSLYFYFLCCGLLAFASCRKVDYTIIDQPAYLRVFNDLNYAQTMDNINSIYPSLCMIIDPVLDADGIPTGGKVVGDFLDKRDVYAPPYPSHIGNSTSVQNPEYPGKENVLVGPVLNGFDLSSWAQVPSGKLRIMFFYRPYTTTPFFELEAKLKKNVLIDTTINLSAKEVYTLHVLQKDFVTKKNGVLLREENFHKLPLSDSLAYINFYNYSAKGFFEADLNLKPKEIPGKDKLGLFISGLKDRMNIFLTLFERQTGKEISPVLKNYNGKYLGTVVRDNESTKVSPYYSFPLWADPGSDGIRTDIWQHVEFLGPGKDITDRPETIVFGDYASVYFLLNGKAAPPAPLSSYIGRFGIPRPNLLVSLHSGTNNPQTFATVSTIEIINSNVYLTTVQRKYPAPVYK